MTIMGLSLTVWFVSELIMWLRNRPRKRSKAATS